MEPAFGQVRNDQKMTNDGVKSEIAEKNSNFGGAKSSIGFVQNITCASVWSPLPLKGGGPTSSFAGFFESLEEIGVLFLTS